jgi:hypothetical protein
VQIFFSLLLLICAVASASEMRLKEKLALSSPGSFLVLEQNRTFTFLHIFERSEKNIIIEEVSISAASFSKNPMNWKEWFEAGAPGHTSWIMSQINLETALFEEAFSFTHRGWIDLSASNSFLTTLLNLPFQEVPENERRRIGLPPGHNKIDTRPLWHPRFIVNGKIIEETSFAAYKTRWPADGTELSHKIIEIYLPMHENLNFPTYFPYWLEVEGKIGSAKIRVVDSGIAARSPKGYLPKRAPQS